MDDVLCARCLATVPPLDGEADLFPSGFRAEQAHFLAWKDGAPPDDPFVVTADGTRIRSAALPFYSGVALCALSHPGRDRDAFILLRDGWVVRDIAVDGTNEWLCRLNREAPLRLATPEHAILYARTALHFVFAPSGGHIRVVEHAGEIPWAADATAMQRAALRHLVAPVACRDRGPDGAWRLAITAVVADGLYRFEAAISGEPDCGRVRLRDETRLAGNLPVLRAPA